LNVPACWAAGGQVAEPTRQAAAAPELLDVALIRAGLSSQQQALLLGLELCTQTDSTNAQMLRSPIAGRHGRCLLAEQQTAGRGRRGRAWHSPFARNIYLSLGWRFAAGSAALAFLPLVVAIAAATAVRSLGVSDVAIKWPNDLLLDGKKLGGCLVEMQGSGDGPCTVVVGVGLNVHMQPDAGDDAIDQPWASLAMVLPGVSRNAATAALLGQLLDHLQHYSEVGFEPFRPAWEALDILSGQAVVVQAETVSCEGIARGIGPRGGLLVAENGRVNEHLAGDVSVRQAARCGPAKPL
jgi:BirA family biotin operon repressor/biotin-[acetyl-CoA-carboxylase] ligase